MDFLPTFSVRGVSLNKMPKSTKTLMYLAQTAFSNPALVAISLIREAPPAIAVIIELYTPGSRSPVSKDFVAPQIDS